MKHAASESFSSSVTSFNENGRLTGSTIIKDGKSEGEIANLDTKDNYECLGGAHE